MKKAIRKCSLILAASVLTFVPFLYGCDTVHLDADITVHFYDTDEGGTSSGQQTAQGSVQGAPTGYTTGNFWDQAKVIDHPLRSEYDDRSRIVSTGTVYSDSGAVDILDGTGEGARVLGQIPNGERVGLITDNGGSLFVKYYADTESPLYYGYINSQCYSSENYY
ncbi:MAG: hypothetical protein IJ071_11685 [Ruminococcus sp.]|nr:hypothetical protein [Ruminococcus sp.]